MKIISDNKVEITAELLRLCQDLIAPGSHITSLDLKRNQIVASSTDASKSSFG